MPDEPNEEVDWGSLPTFSFNTTNTTDAFERMQARARISLEEIRNAPRRRNRSSTIGQVLATLGIELESLALTRDRVSRIVSNLPYGLGNNFRVSRDGSSEINAYFIPRGDEYTVVNYHTESAQKLLEGKYSKNTLGYELISNPLEIDDLEMSLYALLPALEINGDFTSERCATHIHVGGMKNLNFLKNCLKLGLWFDEVFYSLAHMDGDRFRGYSNNAIYARPLMNGPYFKYNREFYQTLNYEEALTANNLYEFFACYGVNSENGEPSKYQPGRYFSINLFSILRIGTVEFRHFNQSFNPLIVSAIAKLCQVFVEVAIRVKYSNLKSFEMGDVFNLESPSHYIYKLYQLMKLAEELECDYYLEPKDIQILEKVIHNYKGIGVENKEVLTHCRDFEVSGDIIEEGKLKRAKNKPCHDGHTDIHNIQYSSIIRE
jgi:hypothetical protein